MDSCRENKQNNLTTIDWSDDDDIKDDIGLDSKDELELLVEMKDKFNVDFGVDPFAQYTTPRLIAEAVLKLMR